MLDFIVKSVTANGVVTFESFMISSVAAIILGAIVAFTFTYRGRSSHSFTFALAMVPFAVQIVIMIVNNNIGTGIAVAGAFNLVRFRSAPGSAKEIVTIFLAMGTGLIAGMGYLAFALLFTLILCLFFLLYSFLDLGTKKNAAVHKTLTITIPEDLDYTGVFTDVFENYTTRYELVRVNTVNMGSMFRLTYNISLADASREKEMIDELRVRNGNLPVMLSLQKSEEAI